MANENSNLVELDFEENFEFLTSFEKLRQKIAVEISKIGNDWIIFMMSAREVKMESYWFLSEKYTRKL